MIKKPSEIDFKKMSDSERQRIEKAHEQLLCLNPTGVMLKPNQEWIPDWSIYELRQLLTALLTSPGGCMSDLFLGFWKALSRTNDPMTETMQDFIADVVYYSWLDHPSLYKNENFDWIVPLVNNGCSQTQAYLAGNVLFCGLPVELIEKCKGSILKVLENTDIIETVQNAFARSIKP
jgi:hypothetical protein